MNKKGFTLVELLVTIAISTIILSLGAIMVNQISKSSKEKAVAIAHDNIKKSANLYSKEFHDELVWMIPEPESGETQETNTSKSCITIEQLISKGYLRKDEVKNATHEYVIIEKDEHNTIISETNSNGSNKVCDAIIYKTISSPTSKDICANLEYTGEDQLLIKNEISDYYVVSGYSRKDANSYPVKVKLKEGYHWKDNDSDEKEVYCTIKKSISYFNIKPKKSISI